MTAQTMPERLQADYDTLCWFINSDLCHDGTFGTSWLACTDNAIISGEGNDIKQQLPLYEIKSSKIDELYSGGRLLVENLNGEFIELIRWSSDLVNEFSDAQRALDKACSGEFIDLPRDIDAARCTDCDAPLPARGEACPLCGSGAQPFRYIMEWVRPYRGRAILLIACTFLSVGAQLIPPYLTKRITDDLVGGAGLDSLGFWILFMSLAFAVSIIARLAANVINAWLSSRIITNVRAQLHAKLQRLAMAYHQRHESGELVSRVTHDTQKLQHFLIDGMPYVLVNSVAFIALAVVLLSLDWVLAICVFLPVPLLIGGGAWFWSRLIPMSHKEGNRVGIMHSSLSESIRGVRAVKATVQEKRRQDDFEENNEVLWSTRFHMESYWFGFFEAMAAAMALGSIAIWWLGPQRIGPDGLSVGDLIAFVGYAALFYGPMQWFAAIFHWMTDAMSGAQRIVQVLNHQEVDIDKKDAQSVDRAKGHVEFENIRFSYRSGKEIIKGIDLDIPAGSMIGLVGKSGAGKSTIINLLCRFYDPDVGVIRIDGMDLRDVKYDDWRRQIGIVMQDPFLFNGSIAENIAYAKPEADFADIVAAAKAACAHEFICDKEEGYDTIVGEGGVSLSGGEKQRIAIARAVLADPPVLILDEATSAVDSETEADIQAAIARLVAGRTTIAIAHRLATLREADRLVVIEDGRVIETGTHAELMAKPDGHFAHLVHLQTEINKIRGEQRIWDE